MDKGLRLFLAISLPFVLELGCDGETSPGSDTSDTTPLSDASDIEDEDPAASDPDLSEDSNADAALDPTGDTPTDAVSDEDLQSDTATDVTPDGSPDVPIDVADDSNQDPGADPRLDPASDGDADAGDAGPAQCLVGFDCDPGELCTGGICSPFVAECTEQGGCSGERECVGGICLEPGRSPYEGLIVINEVLVDGNTDEDANGDGTVDSVEDAFVEIVNISSVSFDISVWKLVERHFSTGLPRHTFDNGTVLFPGDAVVVFGGGDPPDSTDTVLFFSANAADVGDSYGLDLDVVGGDRLRLLDEDGRIVAEFAYGGSGEMAVVTDESATRSPDLVGSFVKHTVAAGSEGSIFSPGYRVNGTPF